MKHPAEQINDRYANKDISDILYALNAQLEVFRKRPKGYRNAERMEYMHWVKEFFSFLMTGETPSSIGIDGLRRFLPTIKNLVEKEQLKEMVLKRFE